MMYRKYYCFNCDTSGDEHREGSCRNCGKAETSLIEKENTDWRARKMHSKGSPHTMVSRTVTFLV